MKMMPQQYCLRWKHHHSNVQNMFAQLLEKERFCDVTLYCSPNFATQVPNKDTVEPQNIRGVSLRAHRVVLAACSELLGTLLGAHDTLGEPVLVIDGAEPKHLRALLDYMYTGEMSVHHSQLASLLKTAEELRIKGLTDIRWNNKDEPPDCPQGGIITTTTEKHSPTPAAASAPKTPECKEIKMECLRERSVERKIDDSTSDMKELKAFLRKDDNDADMKDKLNVNGGPPPLIKLPTKDKGSPIKRENSDTDTPSPKRQRIASGNENTDDDNSYNIKTEREEWQHGNLDISAERVVGWGALGPTSVSGGSWSRDNSDEEWADAPADIGSFLHTRLRVDGDNSAESESECESNQGPGSVMGSQLSAATASALAAAIASDIKIDLIHTAPSNKPGGTTKIGSCDPRFADVVKLNDYLQHGRRPQFWEENYVRRVMEAVRLKELEMKQAAEILGVSYGTLYGRYRDVYGCINRPYSGKFFFDRTARDFWQAKGPSEVLERLQKGEVSLESASQALGVSPNNLAAYLTDYNMVEKGVCEFEPIPIEVDPALKLKSRAFQSSSPASTATPPTPAKRRQQADSKSANRKVVVVGSVDDEDTIPATVISSHAATAATATTAGKWPTIRVSHLDVSPSAPLTPPPQPSRTSSPSRITSPSRLMRTRPDLTIVAAKRDKKDDDSTE